MALVLLVLLVPLLTLVTPCAQGLRAVTRTSAPEDHPGDVGKDSAAPLVLALARNHWAAIGPAEPAPHSASLASKHHGRFSYSGNGSPMAGLVSALMNELGTFDSPLPEDFDRLCHLGRAELSHNAISTGADDLDVVVDSWMLPSDVAHFLKSLKWATGREFRTFQLTQAHSEAGVSGVSSYVAAGQLSPEGEIVMGCVQVDVRGSLQTQQTSVWVCETCCFLSVFCWHCDDCDNCNSCYSRDEPRDFTSDEVLDIRQGLMHFASVRLRGEVLTIPTGVAESRREILSPVRSTCKREFVVS